MLAAQLEKHAFALELSNDSLFCSVDFHMFELSKKKRLIRSQFDQSSSYTNLLHRSWKFHQ